MNHYSQNDEQEFIMSFLNGQKGRFLDIGAHDGESLSNTRALALSGWSGCLVEPHPEHFMKLWKLYGGDPKFTLVNAAVGSGNKGLAHFFFNYEGPAYSSTLNETKAVEFKANDYSKSYLVPVCGVRNLEPFGPFDFINIDAEGVEDEILCQSSILFLKCKLLCIETCPHLDNTLRTQLQGHGFAIVHKTPENLLATKQ